LKPYPKPTPKAKTKPRKKKTPRQIITRDLDILVREIIFARDPYSAPLSYNLETVGDAYEYAIKHSGVDQPGHIISRAKIAVRWDLFNVHKQDANDNLLHEYYPEVYITWFIGQFGLARWEQMVQDSRIITKYFMDDLETLYIELTEIQKWQERTGRKAYFTQRDILSGTWKEKV
jgi:hypothetical protein